MSRLANYLSKIGDSNFDDKERIEKWPLYQDLMADLCGVLDIDEDFLHIWPNVGEGLKPDGLAQINENKRPWAVIEIVPSDSEERKSKAINQARKYLHYSNAELAIILSSSYVVVLDSEGDVLHDVDAVDESGLRKLKHSLSPPEILTQEEEDEEPDGKRTQNYVVEENYEIDLKLLEDALDSVDEAESTQEKGDTFEMLAELLFGAIPFLRVRQRKELTKTSEIDLVVEYTGYSEKTIFDNQSDYILVECKNWSGSVGAPQVRDFRGKMGDLKVDTGVIFARNGVSGDKNSDAHRLIHDSQKQYDQMILVVGDDELNKLLEGESFYQLLDGQMYERRFDLK